MATWCNMGRYGPIGGFESPVTTLSQGVRDMTIFDSLMQEEYTKILDFVGDHTVGRRGYSQDGGDAVEPRQLPRRERRGEIGWDGYCAVVIVTRVFGLYCLHVEYQKGCMPKRPPGVDFSCARTPKQRDSSDPEALGGLIRGQMADSGERSRRQRMVSERPVDNINTDIAPNQNGNVGHTKPSHGLAWRR